MSPNKLIKNSLAFEIILDNPKIKTPAKLTPCNTPTKPLTSEDIKNKLNKAEERRQVFADYNFNLSELCLSACSFDLVHGGCQVVEHQGEGPEVGGGGQDPRRAQHQLSEEG